MTLETLPWLLPVHYPKEDERFPQLAGTYVRPVLPSLTSTRPDAPLSHLLGAASCSAAGQCWEGHLSSWEKCGEVPSVVKRP